MPKTMEYTGRLTIEVCWCGIHHAVPADLVRWARQSSSNAVYCPLGHRWVIRKSDVDIERERAEKAERQLSAERDTSRRLAANLERERRSAIAYKGHLTRIRNRIANGVCPVPECKRSGFKQVERHIATCHPEWAEAHPDALS